MTQQDCPRCHQPFERYKYDVLDFCRNCRLYTRDCGRKVEAWEYVECAGCGEKKFLLHPHELNDHRCDPADEAKLERFEKQKEEFLRPSPFYGTRLAAGFRMVCHDD
jgi:hypothetical protein